MSKLVVNSVSSPRPHTAAALINVCGMSEYVVVLLVHQSDQCNTTPLTKCFELTVPVPEQQCCKIHMQFMFCSNTF